MSKNKFDDLLLKKFQEEELDYQPESWNKLAQKLPNKKRRLFLFPIGIAAAIALILGSVLLLKQNKTEINPVSESSTFTQQKVEEHGIVEPTIEDPKNAQNINQSTNKNKILKISHLANNNKRSNQNTSLIANKTPIKVEIGPVCIIRALPTAKESNSMFEANRIQTKRNLRNGESQNQNSYPAANSEPNYWAKKSNRNETSIGVAGGVNYGSLNAGYTVGLSAKQGLGKDFFIDGTIAVMYNNNTSNLGNYAGKTSARPASGFISMSSPAFSPSQNLYYVQFNPSFGYQIEKDVALSLGADVQKLISNDADVNKVIFTQNGLEAIPTVDFGFTGKAEINVTPNIKTGVIFREGLNTLLNSNDVQYVNRRYFQVQFKYNIPLK